MPKNFSFLNSMVSLTRFKYLFNQLTRIVIGEGMTIITIAIDLAMNAFAAWRAGSCLIRWLAATHGFNCLSLLITPCI